jgi:hypothetical protein
MLGSACQPDPCAPRPLACGCAQDLCGQGERCVATAPGKVRCQAGRCAAPDTPIATPSGERPIAELRVGDLVYSRDRGRIRAVPIARVQRTAVSAHQMMRVELEGGRVLQISPGHPTADGRTFGELRGGDWLGGRAVTSVSVVSYGQPFTYDILPDSDSGTYLASGALIGSTLSITRGR